MTGERIYSVEVAIVRCPGDEVVAASGRFPDGAAILRYCDSCRRWGRCGSTHLCGRNWRSRLSDLLLEMAREGQR